MLRSVVLALVLFALGKPAIAQTAMTGEGTPIAAVATEADYQRVVANAVDGYILPAYAFLEATTGALQASVASFCAGADRASANALRAAFDSTIHAWADVDFLRFGPMAQDGRYERFAFFPDVHGTGARQLRRFLATGDEALLAPGALARQSAAVQGLPALESLLFAGDSALLSAEAPEPFRCSLARAVADNMHLIASEAVAGWQGDRGWVSLIVSPGPDNPVYRTHAEAMTEVLKAILTGLEQVRDHRLLPALGETPDAAKASRAPYNTSGAALTYMAASASALQRFVEASGILGLLPDNQSAYANSVEFEFANLHRALQGVGSDLEAALADPEVRGRLGYAAVVLASLRDLIQRRVAVWAGLTAGFNSLDGD